MRIEESPERLTLRTASWGMSLMLGAVLLLALGGAVGLALDGKASAVLPLLAAAALALFLYAVTEAGGIVLDRPSATVTITRRTFRDRLHDVRPLSEFVGAEFATDPRHVRGRRRSPPDADKRLQLRFATGTARIELAAATGRTGREAARRINRWLGAPRP